MKQTKTLPLLLPATLGLALLVLGCWNIHTSIFHGTLPEVDWHTEHSMLFGFLWVLTFGIILLPAYIFAIELGLLTLTEDEDGPETRRTSYWPLALGLSGLVCLVTYCGQLAVTSWFGSVLALPFVTIRGGLWPGMIAVALMGIILAATRRLLRKL